VQLGVADHGEGSLAGGENDHDCSIVGVAFVMDEGVVKLD
jgi:hypothetical protein